MQTPAVPDLSELNRQLAGDLNRAAKFLDTLPQQIDTLLDEANKLNWEEVRQRSEELARSGDARGLQEMASDARAVNKAIDGDDQQQIHRSLLKLIGRCGTVKLPKSQ